MMRCHRTQRGAALLVAMVVLTLVSTLAAGMVWQQARATEVEAAERTRAQAGWILTGAVDLGRVLLRQDGRTPGVDDKTELWAKAELKSASLSSLLAQDRNNNVEGAPEAYLSGSIRDAQERYNLRNLVDPATNKVVEAELAALLRLCETAAVAPETCQTLAAGLQAAWQAERPGEGEPDAAAVVAPRTLEQLVWLGLDADTVKRLRPYVELLPEPTPLNINTASAEVLAGVIAGLDLASAKRIEGRRPRYRTLQDAQGDIQGEGALDPKRLSVNSNHFEISGQLRMDGRDLAERVLVRRQNREIVPLARWREALPAQPN